MSKIKEVRIIKNVKEKIITININGSFTILNAKILYSTLFSIINKYKKIIINASEISKIDISGVQVLLFIIKYANKLNIETQYTGSNHCEVYPLLQQIGFGELCLEDCLKLEVVKE